MPPATYRSNPLTGNHPQAREPLRPASRPPPLMGRLLSRASPAQKAPHAVGSWPSLRGLRGFDGPCVAARSRATTRQLQRGGLPPSLAPLMRKFSQQSVGAGHARPAALPLPPIYLSHRRARSGPLRHLPGNCRQRYIRRGGIHPSRAPPAAAHLRGASGTPPPTAAIRKPFAAAHAYGRIWNPPLRTNKSCSVGAGHARPAALPLPPLYLSHRRERS